MSFQSSYFYYFFKGFPEGLRLCRSLFSVLVSMFSCFPMRSCIASFKESKSWHNPEAIKGEAILRSCQPKPQAASREPLFCKPRKIPAKKSK